MTNTHSEKLANLPKRKAGLLLGLCGTAGAGKTYTANQLLSHSKFRFVTLQASSPMSVLAKTLLNALKNHRKSPTWVVSMLSQLERGEYLEQDLMVQAFIAGMSSLAPFVLFVEDLHELEPERAQFYTDFAQALQRIPRIALLVTSRTKLPELFESLHLEALDSSESAALITQEFGLSIPDQTLDWVFKQAQGNPLFTLEYLRDLQRQGHLLRSDHGWQWSIPTRVTLPNTVEVLIEQVLSQCSSMALQALEGRVLLEEHDAQALWFVIAKLEADAFNAARSELESLGIMHGILFAHPLFREVTLKRLSEAQKRQFLADLVEALREDNPLLAIRFVPNAGLSASKSLELYRTAIALETDPNRLAYLKAAATKLTAGFERSVLALEALRVLIRIDYLEAVRLADMLLMLDPLNLEVIGLRARLHLNFGENKAAYALFEDFPGEKDVAWKISWGAFLVRAEEYFTAYQFWLANADMHKHASIETKKNLVWMLLDQGLRDQADVLIGELSVQEASNLSEEYDKAFVQFWMYEEAGDYQKCIDLWDYLLNLAQKESNLGFQESLTFQKAACLMQLGNFQEAYKNFEIVLNLPTSTITPLHHAENLTAMASLLICQGFYLEAERKLLEVRTILGHSNWKLSLLFCELNLAQLYLYWKPAFGSMLCLKHARKALEYARQGQIQQFCSPALFLNVLAEIEFGEIETAQTLARELSAISHKTKSAPAYLALWAKGLVLEKTPDLQAAIAQLEEALLGVYQYEDRMLIQIKIAHLKNDSSSAKKLLSRFKANGFGLGVTFALQLFPQLNAPIKPVQTASTLRINALGTLQIFNNNNLVILRGDKRKQFVALLLEAQIVGNPEVKTLELMDTLYSDLNDDEARKAIQQLVFRIRAQLGAESVQTSNDGYALCIVQSDVQDFLETGNTRLWRGAYLEDAQLLTSSGYQSLSEGIYNQLEHQVPSLIENDAIEATRVCRILLEAVPYDLEILKLAIKALKIQKNYTAIARLYARARASWLEVGEQLPDEWTTLIASSDLVLA
jgi:tetratricopeptide (TPR) repeat protein/DNA-binding SARP family transcriptional activator